METKCVYLYQYKTKKNCAGGKCRLRRRERLFKASAEAKFTWTMPNRSQFSCKRVQSRIYSGYAERSRKCQEIYTNILVLLVNGDLVGRTNHTNNMIELVKIRATVQVAIISESNEFVKIREIRGQKISSG